MVAVDIHCGWKLGGNGATNSYILIRDLFFTLSSLAVIVSVGRNIAELQSFSEFVAQICFGRLETTGMVWVRHTCEIWIYIYILFYMFALFCFAAPKVLWE